MSIPSSIVLIPGVLLALSACSTPPPVQLMTEQARARLAAESTIGIAYYHSEFESTVHTNLPSGTGTVLDIILVPAFGGIIASDAIINANREALIKRTMPDPAQLIQDRFKTVAGWQRKRAKAAVTCATENAESLATATGERLVLDFKTWSYYIGTRPSFFFPPPGWGLNYSIRARVVDTSNGDVLWQGFATTFVETKFGWKTLMANGGTRMRELIARATEDCSRILVEQFEKKATKPADAEQL